MRRLIGVLWAGSVSAAICYAEYLGLGAMLGTALLGYGDQSQAMGTLLVVLAAGISCLVLSLRRLPVIAGPRGASLSVLVLGLITLQNHFPVSRSEQLWLLAAMMLGCTAMLFMGTLRWMQWIFDRLPPWLVPAFIYASALSILATASRKYLHNCLLVNEWQTWGIFLSGTLAGLLWHTLCQKISQTPLSPKLAGLVRSLAGTSLVVGAATAWVLYEFSVLPYASAGRCARLGVLDLNVQTFFQRFELLLDHNWQHTPLLSLVLAAVWGLFVGLVVVIESRTAVAGMSQRLHVAMPSVPQHELHQPLMRWSTRFQAILTPATTIASSLALSRTLIIWDLYKPSALAVLCHALTLLAIALFLSRELAQLPQIALLVLMALVACSMLVPALEKTWQEAYSLEHPGIAGGLGLWAVLAITTITQQALIGFLLPALCAVGLHVWRRFHPKPSNHR